MDNIQIIDGGVTAAKGFAAGGVYTGVKSERNDLGMIKSEVLAKAAAVFTQSKTSAAPVRISKEHIADGFAQGILVNSGNANACTGQQGLKDAKTLADLAAKCVGCDPNNILAASTGIIGIPLPMDLITKGFQELPSLLSPSGSDDFAEAMMTTDTFTKQIAVTFKINGKKVTVGGASKGSGMIHPNMATMLGFITTDIAIDGKLLNDALKKSVDHSFNMITVDGDTSTNDTVFVLANGMAENQEIISEGPELELFQKALTQVCVYLAKAIVRDGEGATKLVTVEIVGAGTFEHAKKAAFAVATSSLVKTAMFGEDPNWGRIMAALGYSEADIREEKIDIYIGGEAVVKKGIGINFDEKMLKEHLTNKEIIISIALNMGDAAATVWTCDLSYDYVKINGEYHT